MNDEAAVSVPIMCTLNDAALAERKATTLPELFNDALAIRELGDGYAVQFSGGGETAVRLFNFVQVERQCCAFFHFELHFAPKQAHIWLHLTGQNGVKQFIRSMLADANLPQPIAAVLE